MTEQQQQQQQQSSAKDFSTSPSDLPSSGTLSANPLSTTTSTSTPSTNNDTTTTTAKESSPQPSSNKVTKPITKKKSKKLCHYKSCTNPHSIIGDCTFCFKKFCTRHRLLEAHDCEHYRDVKNDYHERNAKQLHSQQTVSSKV